MARRYIHVHVSVSAEEEVCAFPKPLLLLCLISATNRAPEDLSETLDPDLREDPEVLLDMYACTNQCSLQDKGSLTYYSLNLKKPFDLKLHHKHTTGKVSRMTVTLLNHVGISILTRY